MGDLDYYAKTLQLPRSTSSNPCYLCQCTSSGENTWHDNSFGAKWLDLQWTPSAWLLWDGRSACRLFQTPGITAVSVAPDYMHSKYLGADQYVYGSVFYILCYMVLPGAALENLLVCWNFIKTYYRNFDTKHKFQSIQKLSMFLRKSGGVKLRGKAAEIKGLAPVMLALWEMYMNHSLDIHKKIALLLKVNLKMEELLASCAHEVNLNSEAAALFRRYAFAWAQLQEEVYHFFQNEEISCTLFTCTSKIHQVVHSAINSKFLNPCLVWCFIGEDFMKRVQKLGESCVRGVKAPKAQSKMLMHYRLAMHLQFANH